MTSPDSIFESIRLAASLTDYPSIVRASRVILESIFKQISNSDATSFTTLYQRIRYVLQHHNVEPDLKRNIHKLRLFTNKVVHEELSISRDEAYYCLRILCDITDNLFAVKTPNDLLEKLEVAVTTNSKGENIMSYSAEINRTNPSAFLFVIDQSGSMSDRLTESKTKAQSLSDAINRVLSEIVTKCSKDEGVRNYFEIGVIGYRDNTCDDALRFIGGSLLKPISAIANHPLRVEDRMMKIPDGAGGVVEHSIKFPVWFEPVADGGTPMYKALSMAGNSVKEWCDAHPNAFPPIVIHITDGEPTDGNPEQVAQIADLIKQLQTYDGNVLLFNLHISSGSEAKVLFPSSSHSLSETARLLYNMSSELPEFMVSSAISCGYSSIVKGSRGYGYNADFVDVVNFLEIGTRAVNMAR